MQQLVRSDLLSRFTGLMLKDFCHRSSLGMKHGSLTLNRRQKDSHCNGITQFSSEEEF
jgi:hypothetical protein